MEIQIQHYIVFINVLSIPKSAQMQTAKSNRKFTKNNCEILDYVLFFYVNTAEELT